MQHTHAHRNSTETSSETLTEKHHRIAPPKNTTETLTETLTKTSPKNPCVVVHPDAYLVNPPDSPKTPHYRLFLEVPLDDELVIEKVS